MESRGSLGQKPYRANPLIGLYCLHCGFSHQIMAFRPLYFITLSEISSFMDSILTTIFLLIPQQHQVDLRKQCSDREDGRTDILEYETPWEAIHT